jgi:hypothetical protein
MDNLIEVVETFLITLEITGTNAKTIDITVTTTTDKRRISTTLGKNRSHKTAAVDGLIQRQPIFLNLFRLQSKMKRLLPLPLSKSQAHLQGHLKLRRLKLKVLYLIHHRDQNQNQNRYQQKYPRRLLKTSGNGRRRPSSRRQNPIILRMRLASHCLQNIMTRCFFLENGMRNASNRSTSKLTISRNMSNRYTKHRIGRMSNSTPRSYGMVSFPAEIPSLSSRQESMKVLGVKGPKVGRFLNNTPNEVTQMTMIMLNDH